MFCHAIRFNQKLNFDTRHVTSMRDMFYGAESFNQELYFDTRNVTNSHWKLNKNQRFFSVSLCRNRRSLNKVQNPSLPEIYVLLCRKF